jgi:hypothetical protein
VREEEFSWLRRKYSAGGRKKKIAGKKRRIQQVLKEEFRRYNWQNCANAAVGRIQQLVQRGKVNRGKRNHFPL